MKIFSKLNQWSLLISLVTISLFVLTGSPKQMFKSIDYLKILGYSKTYEVHS